VVERARTAGVQGMLVVGIDVASSRRAVEIATDFGLVSSVGVHPNSALEWGEEAAGSVERLLDEAGVAAVGETGLDFFRDRCPPDVQRTAFRAHIELAKKHRKALVIHTRASATEAIRELAAVEPPDNLVFHCWSGGPEDLRDALRLGAFISFAGNVTFPSAGDLRDLARMVPLERLLVETDSPFLSPVPHRGKPNEPARVADVGVALADALGMHEQELAEAATRNAASLLGLHS
jgi:TatD DNase family protein